jgi:ATP-dependent Clp protease ATP-binding subunit ClpX
VLVLRQVAEAGQEADRRARVYICDECIDLCNEIIEEELADPTQLDELPKPRRSSSSSTLRHRSGRQAASPSRSTTTTSASRPVRRRRRRRARQVQHPAARPTGCGKTYLAQTLARCSTCRSPSPTPPR